MSADEIRADEAAEIQNLSQIARENPSFAASQERRLQELAKKFRKSLLPECIRFLQKPPISPEARNDGTRWLQNFIREAIVRTAEAFGVEGIVKLEIIMDTLIQEANLILRELEALLVKDEKRAVFATAEASPRWWPTMTDRERNERRMTRLRTKFRVD